MHVFFDSYAAPFLHADPALFFCLSCNREQRVHTKGSLMLSFSVIRVSSVVSKVIECNICTQLVHAEQEAPDALLLKDLTVFSFLQMEFERTARTLIKNPLYKGKKVLFVSGVNVDVSPSQ